MRTNNHPVSRRVSSDERAHWDVLEREELRLASYVVFRSPAGRV